ncbi:hypothetical protein AC249_AIPGENE23456 [Exaiptasia diaphana]|nr:hypothetical protein AC249_AIPGENE23456 [Exaiptasia diaphana]
MSPAKVEGAGASQFGFDHSWKPNRDSPTPTSNADKAKKSLNFAGDDLNDVIMITESNRPFNADTQLQYSSPSSQSLAQSRNADVPVSMS